jgi:hypothetical protein
MVYAVGDIYEGYWKNGRLEGTGRIIADEQVYEGHWLKGQKQG